MQNDHLFLALAAAMFPRSQTFEKCIPYWQIKHMNILLDKLRTLSTVFFSSLPTVHLHLWGHMSSWLLSLHCLSIFIQSGLEIQVITKWITIYWTTVCIVFRLDKHISWLIRPVLRTAWVCVQTVLDIWLFTSIEPVFMATWEQQHWHIVNFGVASEKDATRAARVNKA